MSRRERQRRRRQHAHPFRRAVLVGSGLLSAGVIAAGVVFALWVVQTANSAPNISGLKPQVPGGPSQIFAANGERLAYLPSTVVRTPLAGSQQRLKLRQATVAIEDHRFFHHGGVDYEGLLRAAIKDLFEGGGIQGGSTLTMQLVTNIYLPKNIAASHNLRYKIVQAKLATELEDHHSKQWILTQYLNDVPYGSMGGRTAIGVGAASEMFFDKPEQDLNLAQIALLAGLPQAPSEYNPFQDPKLALWRRGLVLDAMARYGYISWATARATQRKPLEVKASDSYQDVRQPYVVDYVEQQLAQDIPAATLDAGGLRVYTTINLADQRAAAAAIKANEGYPGDPAVALTSVNPANGDIVALQNSTRYGTGKGETTFDLASQAARQTGSSFKTFVLMTLIKDDDGDPNSTYYVSKYLAPGWLPGYPDYAVHTAEESYQGTINVTTATALSDNTVYAQLGVDVGIQNVNRIAHAMGITSPLSDNPSEAIGGLHHGVSTLQMADAYATLASGGVHSPATIISKVVQNGKTIWPATPPHRTRVFTQGQAFAGTQTLETVLQYGTGTSANYGCPAAGKTGTTSNYTDAWFVGYTPKLSTAVWVGYPQGEVAMNDINGLGPGFGGTLAAPIWKQFMQSASDGYCGDFPTPTQYWHGVEYFGPHAVSAYVPPVTTTTSSTTTTTPTNTTTPNSGAGGLTTPTVPDSTATTFSTPTGPPSRSGGTGF